MTRRIAALALSLAASALLALPARAQAPSVELTWMSIDGVGVATTPAAE